MKILHYALGFPPYRTGGLTKFCMDLMLEQNRNGYQVALMWPGQMGFFLKKVSIKDRGNVIVEGGEIRSFEVINPLPVSYDEGISNFSDFVGEGDKKVFSQLLEAYRPDIIHIHTLMGLHKNFLVAAREIGIRLIFTAHDFFPICPKVTLFRDGKICESVQSCNECGICNATALGIKKIKILQSPLYRVLKDSFFVKKLRKKHRDGYLSEESTNNAVSVGTPKDFMKLRKHYESMLRMMDMIHYNSLLTKQVYESIFPFQDNCVITISHADVADHRRIKAFQSRKLRLRYLGPMGGAKGFYVLKAALDKLWSEQQNFCLDVHFTPKEMSPYMKVHGRYTYSDLERIFDDTDILIAPSIWYETFGYTVLEALSYGVPVLISGTVGAKDILADGAGIVINNISADKLCAAVKAINKNRLKEMNQAILDNQFIMTLPEMARQIEKKCYMKG